MLLDFVRTQAISLADSFDPQPVLPFQPLSFRDFMLYEQHAVDAGRGLVKRFFPWRNRLLLAYESLTGQRHPGLHPGRLWYEKPIYYMGNHLAFVTEGDVIPWPAYTQALDYELELGVVMAHAVRNVAPQDALEAVGGFTVINDLSARDVQYAEMISGFGPVKSKNFTTAMSVAVVTADEVLPYVGDLDVEVRVNGEVWGKGNTRGAQHSIGEMIAYASSGELLKPGELLATGTISGCSGVEVGRWLSPGDHVELWIERVGTLKSVVGQPES